MELKEKLVILEAVLSWSKARITHFSIWEFDELVNEGYVHAIKIYPKWDAKKGSLATFFNASLYDHVFRNYVKQHDIEVKRDRSDGVQGKRIYNPKMHYTNYMENLVAHQPEDKNIPWNTLKSSPKAVAYLLAIGLSKAQAGRTLGVSGSRISQLALEIKNFVEKERRDE